MSHREPVDNRARYEDEPRPSATSGAPSLSRPEVGLTATGASAEAGWRRRARQLATARRRLHLISTALAVLYPLGLWWSGLWGHAWQTLQQAVPSVWLALVTGLAMYLAGQSLVLLPVHYCGGFVIAHRFGLSRQQVGPWLADWTKGALLTLVLGVSAALLFFWMWTSTGSHWWWLYGLALIVGLAMLNFLAPYVLVPLFYRQAPLDDAALLAQLRLLLQRAGVKLNQICRLDFSRKTVEANAAVIGVGPSRRVVIGDTLLEGFPAAEVVGVVAHELGHHIHRDIVRLLAVESLLLLAGLLLAHAAGLPYLTSMVGEELAAMAAGLPLLFLAVEVFFLVTMPVLNAYSRAVESAADRYALATTGDGVAFASAMRRLARQNLAEERPPRWAVWLYHTHPPLAERVARAERWSAETSRAHPAHEDKQPGRGRSAAPRPGGQERSIG